MAFLNPMLATLVALLFGAAILHLIPKFGPGGKVFSAVLCRAPMLDLLITYFTIVPLIYGPIHGRWQGLLGAIVGQVLTVIIWEKIHEAFHPSARKGPRIVKFNNQLVGIFRNYAACWLTALVTPLFFLIRIATIFIWPPIRMLVRFPKYNDADWINVSRHKFSGLVGHDLIWCLYCDWMTGVWSLATEMLRNVESFWCPIRFDSEKKCVNCTTDFPDIDHGWTPATGNMADVTATLEHHYPPHQNPNAWFGHPVRLTIRGELTSAV